MDRNAHFRADGPDIQRDLEFIAAIVAACAAGADLATLSRIASPGLGPLAEPDTAEFAAMHPTMVGGGAAGFTGSFVSGVAR